MLSEEQPAEPEEAAAYVAELTRELQAIARRSNLHFVAYLLGLAQQEAETLAARGAPTEE